MTWIREFLRVHFGSWWWIMLEDGSRVGPMRNIRAHRWASDAPQPYSIEWNRETPHDETGLRRVFEALARFDQEDK